MIEVRNLSKDFVDVKAVCEISFTVEKGEILGFLGPNGAGKTTTMRIITGFIPPTSGTVRVCGYDVLEHPLQVKRRIGYLPEIPPLYPEMQVDKYLKYVAQLNDIPKQKIKSSIDKVVQTCGLKRSVGRLIGNLSRGFRQRVGLAQALIHDPEILILDEPTAGLDPKQIIEMRNLIKSLAGDHTIILSSHILSEIKMTCGRVVIINEGRIIAIDHHDELSRHLSPNDSYEMILSNIDDKLIDTLTSLKGVLKVGEIPEKENSVFIEVEKDKDIRAEIIRKIVKAKYDILEFKGKDVTLEDVFLKLTSEEEVSIR